METPRFIATDHTKLSNRAQLWVVMDTVNQQDVFLWYGRTGQEKCEAIAQTLNSLGHGKE